MKVLFIWHAAVVEVYRKRIAELAELPNINVCLLVPQSWNEGGHIVKFQMGKEDRNYSIIKGHSIFNFHPSLHLYIRGLVKAIKSFKPDVIHIVEEPYSLVTFQIWLIKSIFCPNAKIVIESWQNIYKDYQFPFGYIERYNLRNSSALIAGSEMVKDVLTCKVKKPVFIVPLGIDVDQYELESRQSGIENKFFKDSFVVGFIGRLERYKGIYTLFDALKKIPESFNVKAVIIGDGSEFENAEKYVLSIGIYDRVFFTGSVNHQNIPGYIAVFNVLVLPSITTKSWKEQFGRVLIEAMACHIPTIGSDSGEIPNVIGDSGLIFREGDSDDLKEKILSLVMDPRYAHQLGELGYQRVNSCYDWLIIAQKTYQCYEFVLNLK